jgi:hypothetical protein
MAYVQGLLAHRSGMGGSLYMAVLSVGTLIGIVSPSLIAGYSQTIFVIPAVLCLVGAAMLMLGDRTTQIEQRLRAQHQPLPEELAVSDAVLATAIASAAVTTEA